MFFPTNLSNLAAEQIAGHDGFSISLTNSLFPQIEITHLNSELKSLDKSISLVSLNSFKKGLTTELNLGLLSESPFLGISSQKIFSSLSLFFDYGLIFFEKKDLHRFTFGGEYFFSSINNILIEYHFNGIKQELVNNFIEKKKYFKKQKVKAVVILRKAVFFKTLPILLFENF